MGRIFINGNVSDSDGGINPNEITARANDVLQGKTTIDDNGNVVNGKIKVSKTNKNHVTSAKEGFLWGDDRGLLYVIRLDYDGQYIPPVSEGGYLYVGYPEPDLKSENIISGKTIGRVKGNIKVMGGTSHNVNGTRGGYDPPSQRFYCDIERGAYINNCWSGYPEIGIHRDVFIHNLGIRPELLRKGYSLFGVEGTMPDYSTGRVVFNGATFDGVLCSGVAMFSTRQDSGFLKPGSTPFIIGLSYRDNYVIGNRVGRRYYKQGVVDDGLKVYIECFNAYDHNMLKMGYILKEAIDLTPFSKIKVGFKILNPTGTPGASLIKVCLAISSTYGNVKYYSDYNFNVVECDQGIVNEIPFEFRTPYILRDSKTQYYIELDIRQNNGLHFISFAASADCYSGTKAQVVFNHVELLN